MLWQVNSHKFRYKMNAIKFFRHFLFLILFSCLFFLNPDLYKKAPGEDHLRTTCGNISSEVLKELTICRGSRGFTKDIVSLSKDIQAKERTDMWCNFVSDVTTGLTSFFKSCDQFLTASQLREAFQRSTSAFLCNKTSRSRLLEMLRSLCVVVNEVGDMFIGLYLNKFSPKLLAFYIQYMLHAGECLPVIPLFKTFYISTQPTDTLDFKEVM